MAIKALRTVDEFRIFAQEAKEIEGYREPLGFAIARVDRGQKNSEKILQATYPVVNWKENYASAAVFVAALKESGVSVDFSASEFSAIATREFVKNAKAVFAPYLDEAAGDAHKNIQVV